MALVEPGSVTTADGITSRPVYAYQPPAAFFAAASDAAPAGPGVYNVMDYGAKADPNFDNRSAIQHAIDAAHDAGGGLIYVPPGTYGITGDPGDPSQGGVRLYDNTFLKGAGMQLDGTGGTVLRVMDNFNVAVSGIVRSPTHAGTDNYGCADITLDGNQANNGTAKNDGWFSGVSPDSLETDNDVYLLRVEAKNNHGYGFDPHQVTTRLTIQDCVSHHNHLDGFTEDYQVDGLFKGNLAYANDRHGFNVVTTTNDSVFENNIARDNGGAGIYVQRGSELIDAPHNLVIKGGEIYGNAGEGIRLWAANNVLVTGVDIHNNGVEGIRLSGASDNTIVGNNIHDNSTSGNGKSSDISIAAVDLNNTDHVTGLVNTVHYDAKNNLIVGNTISDTDANKEKFGVSEKVGTVDHNVVVDNTIAGQAKGDILIVGANSFNSGHVGTAANDTLGGSDAKDFLSGGAGDDVITGGAGDDELWGGIGADTFVATAGMGADTIADWQRGADRIDLKAFAQLKALADVQALATEVAGDTVIDLGNGDTILLSGATIASLTAAQFVFAPVGGGGPSSIVGTAGADTLTGTASAETISGLAGDDAIDGKGGADTLTGGDGADRFIAALGMGVDTITDWQTGADRLDLTAFATLHTLADVTALARQDGTNTVIDLGNGDSLKLSGASVGSLTAAQLVLTPAPLPTITGTAGVDALNGTASAEVISGLAGDDVIDGAGGADTLTGGDGADRFIAKAGMGADAVTDWQTGADTIDLTAFGNLHTLADLTAGALQIGANAVINLGGGDSITLTGATIGSLTAAQFAFAPVLPPSITGTAGADTITGTASEETISALGGDDVIDGAGGADTLTGGDGADRFVAKTGMGADVITDWQTGADKLDLKAFATLHTLADVTAHASQDGADTLIDLGNGDSITLNGTTVASLTEAQFALTPASTGGGGGGTPGTLLVDGSVHVYAGTTAFDTIDFSHVSGGVFVDEAAGTASSARGIDTFSGVEAVVGSAAGDVLLGGRGNSNLTGGAGDDVLTGGYGVDVMTGGAGHDVFRSQYLDIRDGFDQGLDRITDFTLGDTLDLSVRWGGRAFASTRDTAEGTIVTLHAASHQHDVALLQGVHGLTVEDMFAHGALLV